MGKKSKKQRNWKSVLLSKRTRAMAEVEELQKISHEKNPRAPGVIIALLGGVKMADEMLAMYAHEVEEDKHRIVLAS